jgi:hypothetical protein
MPAGKSYVKVLDFPKGCEFRPDVTLGAPTFIDFHVRRWMWSLPVFQQALEHGCRGIRGIRVCDWDAVNQFDF